jgi:hypothetical protein
MKWADYCISKISFKEDGITILEAFVHADKEEFVEQGEIRDRNWLVQQVNNNKTFCCITRDPEGKWLKKGEFRLENGGFKWDIALPKVLTKRKTFVSYYHHDDQKYKERFENLFGDLVVSKSVTQGAIDSNNSDEYIKQLIQKEYLSETTVLVVLVGPKTKCRKHVDWEIAGAISTRVGGNSGLIGILLPTHPSFGENKTYDPNNLPKRLAANLNSGYARLFDWSDERVKMQEWIEAAFKGKSETEKIVNKSIPQMQKDTCE